MSVIHDDFTIERHYACTPQRTFSAFSDPELKRRWFANPGNWPDAEWELEFHVGGGEVNSGGSPGATHHAFKSSFHDIVENERIVTTYEMSMDDQRTSVSVATVELHATPAGTHLVYTEQGAYLDGLDNSDSRRIGTTSQLDNLATVLKEQA